MRRAAVLCALPLSAALALGIPALADSGGKRKAPSHAKAKPADKGKAGKTAICHATGSASNPHVRITISDHALDAHRRHDGDVIPAPAGGDCS